MPSRADDGTELGALGAGAEQLAERIRRDRERWGPVVKALGLKVACINCAWLLDAAGEREIVERYLRTLRKGAAKIAVRLTR
jgi:hypothetical protein